MPQPLRPHPPEASRQVLPAPELALWAHETFIELGAPLHNPDHFHLAGAGILWLWAYGENKRNGRVVLGDCSIPQAPTTGGVWGRALYWQTIEELYGRDGERPDFVIRISAPYFKECDDISACALIEHELYHAGQADDEFGDPKFDRETGLPKWSIRGHSVEEHIGVVERYGAATPDLERLRLALNQPPTVGRASIANACGTCRIAA